MTSYRIEPVADWELLGDELRVHNAYSPVPGGRLVLDTRLEAIEEAWDAVNDGWFGKREVRIEWPDLAALLDALTTLSDP